MPGELTVLFGISGREGVPCPAVLEVHPLLPIAGNSIWSIMPVQYLARSERAVIMGEADRDEGGQTGTFAWPDKIIRSSPSHHRFVWSF
jgi:hypothetical protein